MPFIRPYTLLFFFHVYGSTWLPLASSLRALFFFIAALYFLRRMPWSDSVFLFLFGIIGWNLFHSVDFFNSLKYIFLTAVVLFVEYKVTRFNTVVDRFVGIVVVLRLFIALSLLYQLIGDPRVYDNIFGDDFSSLGNQFSGVFSSVNYFYFYFFTYVSLFILLWKAKIQKSKFDLFLIIVQILVIITNFPLINRTTLIALFVFTIVYSYYFHKKTFIFLVLSIPLLLVLFVSSLSFESMDSLVLKSSDIIEYGIFGNRTELWTGALHLIIDNVYLFSGAGYGNEATILDTLDLINFENLHSHNTYLSLFLELGTLSTLILLVYFYFRFIRINKRFWSFRPFFISFLVFTFFDTVFKSGFNPGHFVFYTVFIFNFRESMSKRESTLFQV